MTEIEMQAHNVHSHSNMHSQTKQETVEKIFHLLDPTLRLLLACQEQLHSILNPNHHHERRAAGSLQRITNGDNGNGNEGEILLTLYKTQSTLFRRLEEDITSLFPSCDESPSSKSNHYDKYHTLQALHDMEEYITLPIILCLQQHQIQKPIHSQSSSPPYYSSSSSSSEETSTSTPSTKLKDIAQSAIQKSLESTSSCLGKYVQYLNHHPTTHIRLPEHVCITATFISTKLRLKCIVALSMTFASILEHTNLTTTTTTTRNNLDKGDDCIQAMLTTLYFLLLAPSSSSSSSSRYSLEKKNKSKMEEEFVSNFFNYIPNGGLMIGIVQNCIQCFGSHHGGNNNHYHSIGSGDSTMDDGRNTNIENQNDIRGNISLKLNALDVMEVLLGLSYITTTRTSNTNTMSEEEDDSGNDEGKKEKNEIDAIVLCFRMIFPSCFTVLFKQLHAHLRFSTSFSSPKLAIKYMIVLTLLLRLTLESQQKDLKCVENTNGEEEDEKDKKTEILEESKMKLMFAISNLKISSKKGNKGCNINDNNKCTNNNRGCSSSDVTEMESSSTTSASSKTTKEYKVFLENVTQRIPFPLTILCKLIPSHTSIKVRMAGVQYLCKCILVDTLPIWGNDDDTEDDKNNKMGDYSNDYALKSLRESAFECLMIMMDDEHEKVSKLCSKVFKLHQSKLSKFAQSYRNVHQRRIISLVLEHIQSLPSVARSRRESELRLKMKLISGFVTMICKTKSSSSSPSNEDQIMNNDYLIMKLMTDPCKQCFVDLFSLEDNVHNNAVTIVSPGQQFKFMREETVKVAKGMIHKISQLLGPKRCVIYADECILNIFDSLSDRIQSQKSSVSDKNHFTWIQKYYGLAVLATELIRGQAHKGKMKKRHLKILDSFTKSVLPIVLGDLLWQLPTTFSWASPLNEHNDKNSTEIIFKQSVTGIIPTSSTTKDLVFNIDEHGYDSNISAAALNGNASIQTVFMQMIEVLSSILGAQFTEYIPVVLYPLLQKTSDVNCALVQTSSFDTLSAISLSSGYKSFDEMLSVQFRYIIEIFSMELQGSFLQSEKHLRQQAVCFYSLHTIVKFILKSLIEQRNSEQKMNNDSPLVDDTQLMVIMEMIQTINAWFNKSFNKSINTLVTFMMVPLSMLQVFNVCMEYVDSQLHFRYDDSRESNSPDENDWTNLLLQFECDEVNENFKDGQEGFKQHLSSQNNSSNKDLPESNEKCFKSVLSVKILGRLALIIQQVMMTNSVFLSIPELKLQKESCDLLSQSFRLLYTLQGFCKRLSENEKSDLSNPLLETVSKYWYPIQARFQSAVQSLCNKNNSARKHLAILLSSLLNLISTLSELCEGFISERFQTTIFPHMSRLFESFLCEDKRKGKDSGNILQYSKEDKHVLKSLLVCVDRVFSTTGNELAAMVPVVGSIILPFVALDGDVGDTAMTAIKALVKVDSDCLWRALLRASGMNIPTRRLLSTNNHIVHPITIHGTTAQTHMEKRCLQIVRFVEGLPEQTIFY